MSKLENRKIDEWWSNWMHGISKGEKRPEKND